jgi:hypothetical protein
MIFRSILFLFWIAPFIVAAQSASPLFSEVTLRKSRDMARQRLLERTILETFSLPFDAENEARYQSAFWAISQFHFSGPEVMAGFSKAIAGFRLASDETRRSCLEALHAIRPNAFQGELRRWLATESNPKVFSMVTLFLDSHDGSVRQETIKLLSRKWPNYTSHPILSVLSAYFNWYSEFRNVPTPPISTLFSHQMLSGTKNVYSFQRWDRDQPGLAVIQAGDGRFMRDSSGQLIVISQLARSGSNLPFFITNGNTPQGMFRIQGTGVSRNLYIGPTPNLQLLMPFEGRWSEYLLQGSSDSTHPLQAYLAILPETWRNYSPMQEAFQAGKAGRSEIIAHGTTIDPDFFVNRPFYPISPTLGCLCAREIWDPATGRLVESDQQSLSDTYRGAPGRDGYLFVINLDDRSMPVSRMEVEKLVEAFEREQFSVSR